MVGLVLHATHAFHCVVVFLHFVHALALVAHVGFYFFVVIVGDVDPESRGEVLGLDACHHFAIIEVETIA